MGQSGLLTAAVDDIPVAGALDRMLCSLGVSARELSSRPGPLLETGRSSGGQAAASFLPRLNLERVFADQFPCSAPPTKVPQGSLCLLSGLATDGLVEGLVLRLWTVASVYREQ